MDNNKPHTGPVHEAMKNDKYRYKLFLREQKESHKTDITDQLYSNLINKDSKSFWKSFKSKLGVKRSYEKVIDGKVIEQEIAESFASTFSRVCAPNSAEHFARAYDQYTDNKKNYSNFPASELSFPLQLIDNIIYKLKKGKAASLDNLTAEHVLFSHPCVISIITYLVNLMYIHEYVPDAFGQTVTFPIPKDSSNKLLASSDNYRGITVSPIISKIFEFCLLNRFEKYLRSSNYQFGFKKKIGCNHAHYTLQKTVEYFIAGDSTVNLCSIDVSKAFDKLNRYTLFTKLMARNCPTNFISTLECWYDKSYTCIKWGNCYSRPVCLPNGIRQGSILSPMLFSVYTSDLLEKLQNSKLGCHIHFISFNAFMYADDLLLLSLSLSDLQTMVTICLEELKKLDMCINIKKSGIIRIGKSYLATVSDIFAGETPVPWGKDMTYLGICFLAGKDIRYDFHKTKSKYFGALNSLLGKIGTKSKETLTLSLVTSKCFPILTYGLEAMRINKTQLSNLSYVYNAIFVKLFSTFKRDIIEQCQFYTGFLPLQYRYDLMRLNFLFTLNSNVVSPANTIFKLLGVEDLSLLCKKYGIHMNLGFPNRSRAVWQHFSVYTDNLNAS